MQNRTIEERVTILEFQVDNINSDLSDLEQNLIVVEDEQEVQSQEIAELQLETDGKRSQDNRITLKLCECLDPKNSMKNSLLNHYKKSNREIYKLSIQFVVSYIAFFKKN